MRHYWVQLCSVVIVCVIATDGCGDSPSAPSSPTAPPTDVTAPPVPKQVSPLDCPAGDGCPLFQVFDYQEGRQVTLVWDSVTDPSGVTYRVQVQDRSTYGGWVDAPSTIPGPAYCPGALMQTHCTFVYLGDEPTSLDGTIAGRWRVWAVDGAGNVGLKSPWWEFLFDNIPDCTETRTSQCR